MGETTAEKSTETTDITTQPASQEKKGPEGWTMTKEIFDARISSARKAALSEALSAIGVSSLDDAKTAVNEKARLEEESKTVAEKTAEQLARLGAEASRVEGLTTTISEYAAAEMATLTETQAAAVREIAGEDPSLQLKVVKSLRNTWADRAAQAAPEQRPAAPASAPQGRPPPEATVSSEPTKRHHYEQIVKNNPFAAADFALRNAREVFPDE